MLDLDPRFLGAVPTPGVLNISRPFYTVSWSQDNQVALITDGGGIFVVVSTQIFLIQRKQSIRLRPQKISTGLGF